MSRIRSATPATWVIGTLFGVLCLSPQANQPMLDAARQAVKGFSIDPASADQAASAYERRQGDRRASHGAAQAVTSHSVTSELQSLAQQAASTARSEGALAQQARFRNSIAQHIGLPIEDRVDASGKQRLAEPDDRVYVFVSGSMPIETLRTYAKDVERLPQGILVLRGFVQGGAQIGPTVRWIAKVLRKDSSCQGAQCALRGTQVIIDPLLFRRYDIKMVPAVVYAPRVTSDAHCEEPNDPPVHATQVVYGDASLAYSIERLLQQRGDPALRRVHQRLTGSTEG